MLELDFSQTLGNLKLEVDVSLPGKGISAVFGLSGAGKTSLINVISGLTKPDKGKIILNGRTLVDSERGLFIAPQKRHIGYVFQDARLFPHYSVKGNLQYGMPSAMLPQFDAIVELLGISHLLKRYPFTLSGGEKQRVAIGRALLTQPELLLMDEPLAALDLPRKQELMPYLEKLSQQVNIPIIYVTHSIEEIIRLASQLLLLERGKVIACGELESVWASEALRPWLQHRDPSSIMNVTLVGQHADYPMSALALGQCHLWVNRIDRKIGQMLRIQIHAGDVSLVLEPPANSSIRNILPAQVDDIFPREDAGQLDVKLIVGGQILWARITTWAGDDLKLRPGQHLYAQIKSVSLSQ